MATVRRGGFPAVALVLALGACGGGGDGGGSTPTLVYVGNGEQAVIDAQNARELAEGAVLGAAEASESSPALRRPPVETATGGRSLLHIVPVLRRMGSPAPRRADLTDQSTDLGECGGSMTITATVDEDTGKFTGQLVADAYCEAGETIDGRASISGRVDDTGTPLYYTLQIGLFTLVDPEVDVSLSGTVHEDLTGLGLLTMTLNFRDNADEATYRFQKYRIETVEVTAAGTAQQMSGRFFHPVHGYVDVETQAPMVFRDGDLTPSEGTALVAGEAQTRARWQARSRAAYQITADLDAGDEFDDYVSGILHYPGMNTPPSATAGPDRLGNVGCAQLELDGSGSIDADGDTISFAWSVVSAPEGSTAVPAEAGARQTTFAPDLPGIYELQLTAADTFGGATQDGVTLEVYGDLFCLGDSVFIPLAETSFPRSIAVADVTNDGRADVVMATSSSGSQGSDPAEDFHLYVLAQSADGLLHEPVKYPAGDGKSLAVGDLNGDGLADVAVSLRTGLGVLYQSAGGGLLPLVEFPYGETVDDYASHEVLIADLNGDGRSDVASVYSTFSEARVRLYAQDAAGGLTPPILLTTDPTDWTAQAADLTGDLRQDLLLTSRELGRGSVRMGLFVKVLVQSPQGSPEAATDYLSLPEPTPDSDDYYGVTAAELTGDGRLDLVASYTSESGPVAGLRLFPQEADGTPGTPTDLPAGGPYQQLLGADLTGDGRQDLAGLEGGNAMVFDVFRQTAQGLAGFERYPAKRPNYNSFAHAFAVGDLNGDGAPDLVSAVYVGNDGGTGVLIVPGNLQHR